MSWDDNISNDIWKYKKFILSKINIANIIDEAHISLETLPGGQFTHRTRCPFHRGKNGGQERTPSMYISTDTNSFYCFGCGVGGNAIDFMSKISGSPPIIVIESFAKKVGLIDGYGEIDNLIVADYEPETRESSEPHLFKISKMIRDYIFYIKGSSFFEKELKWVEKVAAKADSLLAQVDIDDVEYVKNLEDKVLAAINKRKKIYENYNSG